MTCRDVSKDVWDNEQEDELFWYYYFFWHELGKEKELHLTTLGWNQEAWDAKVIDDVVLYRPITEVRAWSKLAAEHKEAAIARGFDSRTCLLTSTRVSQEMINARLTLGCMQSGYSYLVSFLLI